MWHWCSIFYRGNKWYIGALNDSGSILQLLVAEETDATCPDDPAIKWTGEVKKGEGLKVMECANPLGLLGLLTLPAIVAIHLFHRRFPPLLVAGLHFWGAEVRVPTAGRGALTWSRGWGGGQLGRQFS